MEKVRRIQLDECGMQDRLTLHWERSDICSIMKVALLEIASAASAERIRAAANFLNNIAKLPFPPVPFTIVSTGMNERNERAE